MTEDAARRYTLEMSDTDLEVVRSGLQLLLSSEDDRAEIDRIQQILGRLPDEDGRTASGDAGRGSNAPDTPWY